MQLWGVAPVLQTCLSAATSPSSSWMRFFCCSFCSRSVWRLPSPGLPSADIALPGVSPAFFVPDNPVPAEPSVPSFLSCRQSTDDSRR